MTKDAIKRFTHRICTGQYTISELRYCYEVLIDDAWLAEQVAAKTSNPYFMLPAIKRIITETRHTRRLLREGLLTQWELTKLLEKLPSLSESDFQVGGFTPDDVPMYRYAPNVNPSPNGEAKTMQKLWGRSNV